MVFKEDVLQWFKEMESYERIELMHELLHMCLPFEIRFLGGCVEEVGKHSFQELRGPSIIANDIDKLAKDATQLASGVLDRNCRHRMCVYLSLLENRNCQCAHWYFKQVFRTERFDEFAMRQKCIDDGVVLNELLMVFTLGRLHPAFNYHQKDFFSDMLDKLYSIRADKCRALKSAVDAAVPNVPPGFGYSNQIVPYERYVIVCDQSSTIQQQQQQSLDTVCVVKTPSSQGAGSACAAGDLVTVATPPPQPPPGLLPTQAQYHHHHLQPYEHIHSTYWRQPIYTYADPHMMAPPPQPVSPLVSQCASPPHSRPTTPTLTPTSNHSTSSSTTTQQQQHLARSLRGSKDSHNSPQQMAMRMPSAPVYLSPGGSLHQADVANKTTENDNNHVISDDMKTAQMLQQDWTNPGLGHLSNLHATVPPPFGFTAQQMAPHPAAHAPNGLRNCFATHFPQHHALIALDQQHAMFGYDLDYQHQQQMNGIQLDNTIHQSGSSSNNSSNASSLNQSPPDTPASTPTPAHHGPGRGNRDAGIGGITEKLRVLDNVSSMTFMTPPPPPINDGNLPPQQFTVQPYNVPYASGLGGGRAIFSRGVPTFTHAFSAPPPPQQQTQPPPTAYIMGARYIMSPIINGNNPVVLPHSSSASNTITAPLRPVQTSAGMTATGSLASDRTVTSCANVIGSGASGQCCTFCCNCGSSEHCDADCTVPHIDDIVTQAGYALDYDDSGGGGGAVTVGQPGGAQTPGGQVIVATVDHMRPDI